MDLDNRKFEATQKFEEAKARREDYLKQAEDELLEMTKLQGEYRLIEELQEKEANKQPTVIEAIPEVKKEKK